MSEDHITRKESLDHEKSTTDGFAETAEGLRNARVAIRVAFEDIIQEINRFRDAVKEVLADHELRLDNLER